MTSPADNTFLQTFTAIECDAVSWVDDVIYKRKDRAGKSQNKQNKWAREGVSTFQVLSFTHLPPEIFNCFLLEWMPTFLHFLFHCKISESHREAQSLQLPVLMFFPLSYINVIMDEYKRKVRIKFVIEFSDSE